jgi:hypothetical protein
MVGNHAPRSSSGIASIAAGLSALTQPFKLRLCRGMSGGVVLASGFTSSFADKVRVSASVASAFLGKSVWPVRGSRLWREAREQ